MPRNTKETKTLDEQLNEVNAEISSYQQKLSEAKEKRKKLEEQKKLQDMEEIYQAVVASGKPIDEILQALTGQHKAAE
jgi:chromosome segregation ATPase